MAHIVRIKSTRKLPQNAKIVEQDGEKYVKLKRKGRTVKRPVLPCGTRYRDESVKWYIQIKNAEGKWERVPGYTDKDATQQLMAELERKVERKNAGLVDPFEDTVKQSLVEHLNDYEKYLISKGDSQKHVRLTRRRIAKALQGCRFKMSNDISASKLSTWLSEERITGRMGVKTSNYYQSAAKAFCNWLVKDRRVPHNPLAHLSALNAETDIRRQRRTVSEEEFLWLIQAATNGLPIQCVDGIDRAMLYVLASWTGYRRKELASLTYNSFDFDSEPPTIRVRAAYSKRKRNDVVPLHPIVVKHLREWLATKEISDCDSPVFPLKAPGGELRSTSKMMRIDLERARRLWIESASNSAEKKKREKSDLLTYCNADGFFADFHANRHTFISNLVKAGISPKLTQTLARHSDIKLTMNVYTHVDNSELGNAVEKLAAPPTPNPCATADPRTELSKTVAHMVAQTSGSGCHTLATGVHETVPSTEGLEMQKPLPEQGLCAVCHPMSLVDISSGEGTRTPDTRIMIPLL